jgi:hypothetical protein
VRACFVSADDLEGACLEGERDSVRRSRTCSWPCAVVSISSIRCCLDATAQKALCVAVSEKAACRATSGASSAVFAFTLEDLQLRKQRRITVFVINRRSNLHVCEMRDE